MNKKFFLNSVFLSMFILLSAYFVLGAVTIEFPLANSVLSPTNISVVVKGMNRDNTTVTSVDNWENITLFYVNFTDAAVGTPYTRAVINSYAVSGTANTTNCVNNACNFTGIQPTAVGFWWDASGVGDTTGNGFLGFNLTAQIRSENGTTHNSTEILNISLDSTAPTISLENITSSGIYTKGKDGSYQQTLSLRFNITATDSHFANCTLWHNLNGTWYENGTTHELNNTNATSGTFNLTAGFGIDGGSIKSDSGHTDGTYTWGAICYDDASYGNYSVGDVDTIEKAPNIRYATNITFYIDGATPVFNKKYKSGGNDDASPILIKDSDGDDSDTLSKLIAGTYATELGETLTVTCDTADDVAGVSNVEYFLKKPGMTSFKKLATSSCPTSTDVKKCKIDSAEIFKSGTYYLYCRVSDNAGNAVSSSSEANAFKFLVQAEEEGEVTAETTTGEPVVKEAVFSVDFSKVNEKIIAEPQGRILTMSFDGATEHTVTFDKVSSEEVTLTIASDPITITLKRGETKNVDINNDGTNDVSIRYKEFVAGNAQVEFKKLEGAAIVAEEERPRATTTTVPRVAPTEPRRGAGVWLVVGIVVVGLVVYFLVRKKKK